VKIPRSLLRGIFNALESFPDFGSKYGWVDSSGRILWQAMLAGWGQDENGVGRGDINGDGNVNLADGVLALQILVGLEPSTAVSKEADVNGDGRIGLQEVMYIFQKAAGLRQ
jgi:hypothetical protein